MRDSKVRTIRPLKLTADVVLRPSGPLDAECAEELREAVDYIATRPGGPIVVDCSEVSDVSAAGSAVLRWVEQEPHGDRAVHLRHLHPQTTPATHRDDASGASS